MSARTPQYRYWLSDDGKWRFCLVGSNGKQQGTSHGYRSMVGLLSGIRAHQRSSRLAAAVWVEKAPSA